MKAIWQKLHNIGGILHLPDMPHWLIGLIALVLVLRIPSFFEPYYYGDEMIYMSLGTGVRQGLTLYKDIYDNKPPLLYLTAAVAGSLFWFKAILAFWNLATIYIFYKLAEKLFPKNEKAQKIATVIMAILTTIPLLEGNIVNAELFMIGPSILAFLLLLSDKLNIKKIFMAGALFGIAALFKIPAAFEMPVVIAFWFFSLTKSGWKEFIKNSIALTVGFAFPIVLTFIWYFFKGALNEYISAAFMQNVGYVSSWQFGKTQAPFLVRNAHLLIRGGVVVSGYVILFLSRKKLSPRFLFLATWVLFALFGVALSERPYPHYLIQVVPVVSLFLATFFAEKSYEQSLVVIPLALTLFVPVYYHFWFYPTSTYYVRFLNFAAGRMSKDAYFNDFAPTVTRNYQIADFLINSAGKNDHVFMWDPDSPTVYALSRRLPIIKYVANYHVLDYSTTEEVVKELSINPPKFIVLTSESPLPPISPLLKKGYLKIQQIDNAEIWSRVYNSGNATKR